ncbi:hypothetical protein ABTX71_29990 [Streptomyces parvulus]|uniref:hypothetical protein n=1 Tax=Streptomyces parvulus TaxID=146923 RepID=UPI0033179878
MADGTAPQRPQTTVPLVIMDGVADGYCDPGTGVCVLPGAATPSPPNLGGRADEPVAPPKH